MATASQRDAPPVWAGLALVVADDRLLLSPAGAALVASALDRIARVDRVQLSPQARALRDAAAAVGRHSGPRPADINGPPDVRNRPTAPASDVAPTDDWISAARAGELLGVTREHAGRLARDGQLGITRVHRGRREVLEAEVHAHLDTTERTAS